MALEASDMNDGTILQQTKQLTDNKGQIQFNITLPSGRILKSEFMSKDNARQGMRQWLEVVKEQAVADSNAERLERAAKGRRGKMDIERKPGDDQPLFRAGGARVADVVEVPGDPAGMENSYTHPAAKEPTYSANDYGTANKALDAMAKNAAAVNAAIADTDPLEYARTQRELYAAKVEELKHAEKRLWQWSVIVNQLEEKEE